ncbi:hypothetical protein F3W84_01800 [Ochrobactrum quorumnocens]|uniref:Uncharacterized protein n=2 Tax=Ochrobactrum quorumnocens TaxID=271865 RepID=A0A5N1K8Y3_9HYPH|nr:hypothetical protein F3W84_01800 [[Ochrobactrum] quorumnocens]
MLYYARRAFGILRTRGGISLAVHAMRFIAYKLNLRGMSSYINDSSKLAGKVDVNGVVLARTLPDNINPPLTVPFKAPDADIIFDKAAVIAHIFYPELTEEIIDYVKNIPIPYGLFITTDTVEKKQAIYDVVSKSNINAIEIEIRVTPNRGRDVAPKYIGYQDVYARYEAFLHIHSKKSLHANGLGTVWRKYLLDHLIGTSEIAEANLKLLSAQNIGVVYPEHEKQVKKHINWGYDFPIAKELLRKVGVTLDSNTILEFPSGSMFWGRSRAIQLLLDLNLDFADFPEEKGQIDGTLAHAIERSLLLLVEKSGHSWARITKRQLGKNAPSFNTMMFVPLLGSERSEIGLVSTTIRETLRILTAPQCDSRPRLNLMLHTVNPAAIFGGIDTALKLFAEMLQAAGDDIDVRIIVTEALVSDVPDALENYIVQKIGNEKPARHVILDATSRAKHRLNVRPNDVFVATAWWTAFNAFQLHDLQKEFFGRAPKVVYLMQDFEPDFYGWSTRYALAESTYMRGEDTLALINSEELLKYFSSKYKHPIKMVIPYQPNVKVDAKLRPLPREKTILFYSRPSALRNCFEAGLDGLHLWARRNPVQASEWNVYCIGEKFDSSLAQKIPNCVITGKMPLDEYAGLLSRASVGVSLMISPHPSYPPLEMAYAGIKTITNNYTCKDLTERSDLITSIDIPTPELIAQALEEAVNFAEVEMVGKITSVRNVVRNIPVDAPYFDAAEVNKIIGFAI